MLTKGLASKIQIVKKLKIQVGKIYASQTKHVAQPKHHLVIFSKSNLFNDA